MSREQEGGFGADADEEVGHRAVEPMAPRVGVGVRDDRGRQLQARREVGEQAGQLAGAGTQMLPQDVRLDRPHEVLERGRERAVRKADDPVAVAVEDGGALVGDVPGEPGSPATNAARRPSPAVRGTRARRAARSCARPANANAGEKRSGPGREAPVGI